MIRIAAFAVLAVICGEVLPQACFAKCVNRAPTRAVDSASVSRINDAGFTDLRNADPASATMASPVSSWYIRELIASEKASNLVASRDNSITQNLLDGGYSVNTGLWIRRQLHIPSMALEEIQHGLCGDITLADWNPLDDESAPNPQLGAILNWVDAIGHGNDRDIQSVFDRSGVPQAVSRDSIIALNVVSIKADFTDQLSGLGVRDLPYYSDGPLSGIRLDAKDGHTSLYVILGDMTHLQKLRRNITTQWKQLRTRFMETSVDVQDVVWKRQHLSILDVGAEGLFGTTLPRGGFLQQASSFSLLDGVLNVTAVSSLLGVEEEQGERQFRTDQHPIFSNAVLHFMQPMLYILEDRSTGLILFAGYHP